jgi:hypothetical protein
MGQVIRIDAGTLRPPVEMPNGFLRVEGLIARPGIYEYTNTAADEKAGLGPIGKVRRELRPDDEAFRPETLAGFEGMSITNDHPSQMVTVDNVRALEVGSVSGPARRDGGHAAATLVLKDKKAIAAVKSKKLAQLSPGYRMRLDKTSGVDPKYGAYDVVQRDIVPNHLALVDRARGGSALQIRMDGADVEAPFEREAPTRFDAADQRREVITMDADEQIRSLKAQLTEAETKAETAEGKVAVLSSRADKAEQIVKTRDEQIVELETRISAGATAAESAAIATQAARADKAELEVAKNAERFDAAVKQRTSVMFRARAVMGEAFRMDGMSNRDIEAAVISKLRPKDDTGPTLSDDQIFGRFDSLVELHAVSARSLVRAGESLTERTDSAEKNTDSREARAKAWHDQAKPGANKKKKGE